MASRRVSTDDLVYDIPMVYLGPDDHTLPFEARYLSLGVWLAFTALWWATDRYLLFGQLGWAVFVLGPISAAVLMQIVDHERPLSAHAQSFAYEVARVAQRRRVGPSAVEVLMRVEVQPTLGPAKQSRTPRWLRRFGARTKETSFPDV